MFIRRQKAFTGLVVLALTAVIVDRMFLPAPDGAQARQSAPATRPAAQLHPSPKPDPSEQFRRGHRLTATMLNGQLSQALVDGRFITLGQSLDGFRLTAVSSTTATFESAGDKVILSTAPEPPRAGRR